MDSTTDALAALNPLRGRDHTLFRSRIPRRVRVTRPASRFGTVSEQSCQSPQAPRTPALACLAGQQAPVPRRQHAYDRVHAHRLRLRKSPVALSCAARAVPALLSQAHEADSGGAGEDRLGERVSARLFHAASWANSTLRSGQDWSTRVQ